MKAVPRRVNHQPEEAVAWVGCCLVKPDVESCMNYIFSRLALGNVRDAQADPPVDAILNISEFHYPTNRIYRNLYFPDGIYIRPLVLIGECTEFIHEQLRQGRRV